MDLSSIIGIMSALLQGGPHAINALLTICIVGLLFERRRLTTIIEKKDDKIEKIVDDYHNGNLTIADAMTSLKLVLAEIRGRIDD